MRLQATLSTVLALSLCGISGYLLYLVLKKHDDEDDYLDPVNKTSKFKTVYLNVPKSVVGGLIGRNGDNIKTIQAQSGTRINFKDGDNKDERVCVIRGALEACTVAESLIEDHIRNQPEILSEDIEVPSGAIGKIVGRCGKKVNEIRTISGAKVNIIDDSRNVPLRRITLTGTSLQIVVAKSLIEETVAEAKLFLEEMEDALSKREPRIKIKTSSKLELSPKVERMSPVPGQPDGQFEVYVSAMVDPSRFWLQIVGPKAQELDCLVEEMTSYYSNQEVRTFHALQEVKKGDLVAAVFQYDNKWYRAEVLNLVEPEQAELYYVDYGDTDIVNIEEIFELRTDFLKLHFQAIECFLARVDPIGDAWSGEAVDKFEEWTHVAQWKKLSAKINGYQVREKTRAQREGSPVPGIDLFDVNNDQDVDIAEELVRSGLAIYKKNADLRPSSRATSISNISVASSS